jgi:hypothetical protein
MPQGQLMIRSQGGPHGVSGRFREGYLHEGEGSFAREDLRLALMRRTAWRLSPMAAVMALDLIALEKWVGELEAQLGAPRETRWTCYGEAAR